MADGLIVFAYGLRMYSQRALQPEQNAPQKRPPGRRSGKQTREEKSMKASLTIQSTKTPGGFKPLVVEASTDLQNWTPVSTNTLVNGVSTLVDSTWTNQPQRFYRVLAE